MLELSRGIVELSDRNAAGSPIEATLASLRGLSLEEFGELLISMPNEEFPGLSQVLPRMTPAEIQRVWTGSDGLALHAQTAAFLRGFELAYMRATGQPLQGRTILDFGVGYGRIMRGLYYFSDPARLWGVDAWDASLDHSRKAGILGNLRLSERVPSELPTGDVRFDAALAFSIFTHLAPHCAEACLAAVRKSMADGGIFVITIRPFEFWAYNAEFGNAEVFAEKEAEHRAKGWAFLPDPRPEVLDYGDTTLGMDFLMAQPGWKVLGHDWSRVDPHQVSVTLQAV